MNLSLSDLIKSFNLLLICGFITFACQKPAHKYQEGSEIYLADPTVFLHEGVYYLYGTGGHNSSHGFKVYTSTDLRHWEGPKGAQEGYALKKGDVFGDKGFWAPQVFVHEGRFYMAYTANENIAIAESDSPLGPFVQKEKKSLESAHKAD